MKMVRNGVFNKHSVIKTLTKVGGVFVVIVGIQNSRIVALNAEHSINTLAQVIIGFAYQFLATE